MNRLQCVLVAMLVSMRAAVRLKLLSEQPEHDANVQDDEAEEVDDAEDQSDVMNQSTVQPSVRCCCNREFPLFKYVCIDYDQDDGPVYSPLSWRFNDDEQLPRNVSFLKKRMSEGDEAIFRKMLQDKTEHTLKVQTNVYHRCNENKTAVVFEEAAGEESSLTAYQLKYPDKTWKHYSPVQTSTKYNKALKHIEVDGVVYVESDDILAVASEPKCLHHTTTANLLRVDSCVEHSSCQTLIQPHACSLDGGKGSLFKRIGRTGSCARGDELRKAKRFGLFGELMDYCPADQFGPSNTRSFRGYRFCDCKNACE